MVYNKLTKVEERIIGQLDLDARSRFRQIGKKIRKSEQAVSYSVSSLAKKGVIKGFYTLIDFSRLGVLNFRVFFRLNYINDAKFNSLANFLATESHTMWIAACGARYDMICTFAARNPSQFNKLIRRIMAEFSDQIQGYSILTTIVMRVFNRKYMNSGRTPTKEVIIGGDREPYRLSERDIRILSEVADNPRESSVNISRKLSCDARTVVNRLKELEQMDVIRGARPFLDFSNIDYVMNILILRYHNISVQDEESLINYLLAHPNVISVVKTLGEWDLEINIEALDKWEFKKVERSIRERFSGIIQMTEAVPIYHEFKKTFFPRFILDDAVKKAEERPGKPQETAPTAP